MENFWEKLSLVDLVPLGAGTTLLGTLDPLDYGHFMLNAVRHKNVYNTMGEYVLTSPMLSIPMGVADVVLGVQWLQSLGTIAFNFQELFIKFSRKERKLN